MIDDVLCFTVQYRYLVGTSTHTRRRVRDDEWMVMMMLDDGCPSASFVANLLL